MMIQMGRVWAIDIDDALEQIRQKYGDGRVHIREANVQPRAGWKWYEFTIDMEGTE